MTVWAPDQFIINEEVVSVFIFIFGYGYTVDSTKCDRRYDRWYDTAGV